MSKIGDFFGATGGSVFPVPLQAEDIGLTADNPQLSLNQRRLPGFSKNGDWIELPGTDGDPVEYYNSSDVLQWSVSPTDINAAADSWIGFDGDETDSLIYVVAVDQATTPDTMYLASINSSGTVVNIGNSQPSSFVTTLDWFTATTAQETCFLQRTGDGSGNFIVRFSVDATTHQEIREIELNESNGSVVSENTIAFYQLNELSAGFKTQSGFHFGFNTQPSGSNDLNINIYKENRSVIGNQPMPNSLTAFHERYTDTTRYLRWFGSVAMIARTSSNDRPRAQLFNPAQLDTFVVETAKVLGLT